MYTIKTKHLLMTLLIGSFTLSILMAQLVDGRGWYDFMSVGFLCLRLGIYMSESMQVGFFKHSSLLGQACHALSIPAYFLAGAAAFAYAVRLYFF